jgi:hypothetical protein
VPRELFYLQPQKRNTFVSSLPLSLGTKVNSLKGVSLEDVPIVREYPDVFSEELPAMPTGPIAKRPYKMDVDELKELKK